MTIIRGRSAGASEQRGATFTGPVWADSVLPSTDGVVINVVFFQPGSHTFWHRHERGQILQVLTGEGLVCVEGGTPQLIRAGDTVWCPPGERHWHGATPTSLMSHTAISLGATEWAEEVPQHDYFAPNLTKDNE
jgi:quercetin dioxygenase-like cupin family protein